MAKTKSKSTKYLPDAALIHECVSYAQAIYASNGGFRADPDDTPNTAEKLGRTYDAAAAAALNKITRSFTRTAKGLDAKRRIAEIILHERSQGSSAIFHEEDLAFLSAFFHDLRARFEDDIRDAKAA